MSLLSTEYFHFVSHQFFRCTSENFSGNISELLKLHIFESDTSASGGLRPSCVVIVHMHWKVCGGRDRWLSLAHFKNKDSGFFCCYFLLLFPQNHLLTVCRPARLTPRALWQELSDRSLSHTVAAFQKPDPWVNLAEKQHAPRLQLNMTKTTCCDRIYFFTFPSVRCFGKCLSARKWLSHELTHRPSERLLPSAILHHVDN